MLVLIDQDGVLADFGAGFDRAWLARRETDPTMPYFPARTSPVFSLKSLYPPVWQPLVAAVQQEVGFVAGLPVIEGAVDGMRALARAGHDVRICTAPLSAYENCVAEKYRWVETHLGREWVAKIIVTKDKTLVAGDVLFDDKPAVSGTLSPTWTHVRFEASYNAGLPGPRATWASFAHVLTQVGAGRERSVLERARR